MTRKLSVGLRQRHWPLALGLLLTLALLVAEPTFVDFFQKGHYNWVSLHSLAIAKHSDLAIGGVGFSCADIRPDGQIWYDYFNRYPLPFALVSRWVLAPWSGDAVAWMHAARQFMNLIFIATGVALWWWLRSMCFSRPVAMGALLLTGAAPVVLEYRSMFHFDQPALLAYALLLVVVVRKLLVPHPNMRWYWGMILIAALSGRSAVALIFSLILPLTLTVFRSPKNSGAVWLGVPVAFGSVFVGTAYNVLWEMRLNQISWSQTSVVQSAFRRLGLSGEGFAPRHLERTGWLSGAIPEIVDNLNEYLLPLLTVLGLLLLLWFCLRFTAQSFQTCTTPSEGLCTVNAPRRLLLWSTGLTSLIWVLVMKNLFVFHVYAGMMILPFLLFCTALMLEQMVVLASGCAAISARSLNKAVVCASVSVFLLVLVLGPPAAQRPGQERRLVLEEFFKELAEYRALSQAPPLVVKNTDWFPRSPMLNARCLMDLHLRHVNRASSTSASVVPSKP